MDERNEEFVEATEIVLGADLMPNAQLACHAALAFQQYAKARGMDILDLSFIDLALIMVDETKNWE